MNRRLIKTKALKDRFYSWDWMTHCDVVMEWLNSKCRVKFPE